MHIIDHPPAAAPANARQALTGKQFLVFRLGSEEYGVDVQQVQELRNYQAVTRIANASAFIKGLINLRGVIVPIIDLRIKFYLGVSNYDVFTVVIILNIGAKVIGIVVDRVSDVVVLMPEHIKPALAGGCGAFDAGYLAGIGTVDNRMLILVDADRLIRAGDPTYSEALVA
ncbi:MAG: chemotaxis protein CheW [Duganella sp.]